MSIHKKTHMHPAIMAGGTIAGITMMLVGIALPAVGSDASSTFISQVFTHNKEVEVIDETHVVDGLSKEERIAKVREYFESYDMPAADYAESFVTHADEYGIDWTLVPAIAYLESTGFKNSCQTASYSGLGWGSCNIDFSSYDESIRIVSMNLGGHNPNTARYYEGKTPEQILHAYNPKYVVGISKNYHGRALAIMDDIKEHPTIASQLAYSE